MPEVKTIAIIEATTEMGSAIAKSLLSIGRYRLLLMSNDQEKLDNLQTQLESIQPNKEVFTTSCAREASWEADIIILAIPHAFESEVAARIREVATGKIVITTSNPLIEAYYHSDTREDTSTAEELQRILPYSKIVKAFHTMFPNDFAAAINGQAVSAFIAGNSGEAVEAVLQIARNVGLNPIVVGDLAVSRTLERMRVEVIRHVIKDYNWLGVGKYFTRKK